MSLELIKQLADGYRGSDAKVSINRDLLTFADEYGEERGVPKIDRNPVKRDGLAVKGLYEIKAKDLCRFVDDLDRPIKTETPVPEPVRNQLSTLPTGAVGEPGDEEGGLAGQENTPPPGSNEASPKALPEGPTIEEFVLAGYEWDNYPPPGYAAKASEANPEGKPGKDVIKPDPKPEPKGKKAK